MNTIIYEMYYVKEAAKETFPEGKHVTFLWASMPLDTRLATHFVRASCVPEVY